MAQRFPGVTGFIESPGGRLRIARLERDGYALWGKPDERGRPVWIAPVLRLLKGRRRPLPFQLLRDDSLAPIALPGENPRTVPFRQMQALLRDRLHRIRAGYSPGGSKVERLLIINLVILSITLCFLIGGLALFAPKLVEALRGIRLFGAISPGAGIAALFASLLGMVRTKEAPTAQVEPAQARRQATGTLTCEALWLGHPLGLDRTVRVRLDPLPPVNTYRFLERRFLPMKPFLYLAPRPDAPSEVGEYTPVTGRYLVGWRLTRFPPFLRRRWEEFPEGWVYAPRAHDWTGWESDDGDGTGRETLAQLWQSAGAGDVVLPTPTSPYEMGAEAELKQYQRLTGKRENAMADRLKTASIWLAVAMIAGIVLMVLFSRGGA